MKNKKVNLEKAAGGGMGSLFKKAGTTIFGAAKKFGSSKTGQGILKAGGKELLKLGKSKFGKKSLSQSEPDFEEDPFMNDDFD